MSIPMPDPIPPSTDRRTFLLGAALPLGLGGGRPTVLALVDRLYGEAALLATAEAWQTVTDHHLGRPTLTR